MNFRLLFLLLLLLLPSFRLPAAGLPASANGVPVDLEADQLDFDQVTGRYHAQGNVRLKQGAMQLSSEQLWWNQQTGEVDARGKVHFTQPGEELSGRRLTYDLQQGTGVVEDGEIFLSANSLRMKGKRLERLGPKRFSLYGAHITLCEGKRPAWSIGASQADVTIGRYLTAKHARIYVKDVPFFYTPYLRVPIKNERESGFLMPGFGFSDRRGTEFSTAWYQVLGRNQDATFSIDYLSLLGTGLGLEYRYVFGNKQRGKLNAYTIIGRDNTKRWNFNWTESYRFPRL
ncbi:MAG: hypothetical protein L3J63_03470 [Geopsychrobacter sp.]|nr:hypothetical protein [Geopsychrobacter sp.]